MKSSWPLGSGEELGGAGKRQSPVRVIPGPQKADPERRRQEREEVSELDAEVAAIEVDAEDMLDERVVIARLDVAAGKDPVEAGTRAEAEQVLMQVLAGSRVGKVHVGMARDHRRRKRRDGNLPAEELVGHVDAVILEGPVVLAVVDREVRPRQVGVRTAERGAGIGAVVLVAHERDADGQREMVRHAVAELHPDALSPNVPAIDLSRMGHAEVVLRRKRVAVPEREPRLALRGEPRLRTGGG